MPRSAWLPTLSIDGSGSYFCGMTRGPISVYIFDDQEIVRLALALDFKYDPRTKCVGTAQNMAEARDDIDGLDPDVVTTEILVPGSNGLELVDWIKRTHSDTTVVVVSSLSHPALVRRARRTGADAYVDKVTPAQEIIDMVVDVHTNGSFEWSELESLNRVVPRVDAIRLRALTPRERQILEAIGHGKINREIADEFHLTEKTVKNYVSHLLQKLDMHSRSEVAALAGRLDLAEHPYVPECDWSEDFASTAPSG